MKTMSAGLEAHYGQQSASIATCWLVSRQDGFVLSLTDHIDDLTIGGVTYEASSGYTTSAMQATDKLSVDNLEIDGYLDSSSITREDLLAGRWDFAGIQIFEVNYTDLSQGILKLRRGWIGEVSTEEGRFVAELRGLTQAVQQNICDTVQPSCGADLGDSRCKINLGTFTDGTAALTVTSRTSNQVFGASALTPATGWFNGGLLTWATGNNAGLKMEVRSFVSGGAITLVLPMVFNVQVGDTGTITAGCDKSVQTCFSKFNNVVNFRGFPHVPGNNRLLSGS